MKHSKHHVTHVAFSALNHFHVHSERIGKLPREQRITLFEAIDKHLERRDHGGSVGCDDFTFR